MRNYSIAGKRGQWPAPEDTSLSYLIYLSKHRVHKQLHYVQFKVTVVNVCG